MRRSLFAILAITGLIGCAAPGPTVPSATTSPAMPTAVPTAAPTALPPSKDSALQIEWLESHGELRRIDLATGQPVPGLVAIDMGMYEMHTLSQDGARLALFRYPSNEKPDGGTLEVIDTQALHATTVEGVSFPSMVNLMALSPDGNRLAVVNYNNLVQPVANTSPTNDYLISVIDLERQTVAAQAAVDFSPRLLRFSADGASIIAYGARYNQIDVSGPGIARLALLDAADLHSLWTTTIDRLLDGNYMPDNTPGVFEASTWWQPAAVFSADSTQLYLVHADVDKLTTVDLSRKSMATVAVSPQKTFLDRLMGFGAGIAHAKAARGAVLSGVLSADGSKLFVVGNKMDFTVDSGNQFGFTNTALDLRVIEVSSGALLNTARTTATEMARSVDGSHLFLYSYDDHGEPSTEILDAETLERQAEVSDLHVYPRPVRLADGRVALLAERWSGSASTVQAVLDAGTFARISEWKGPSSGGWLVER